MTLPASGSLTIAQIATELGRTGTQIIPDNGWRTLAGKAAGASITIPTDYYGKSRATRQELSSPNDIDGSQTSNFTMSFGEVGPSRRIAVAVHWCAGATNLTLSSATIGGISATIHIQDSHTGGSTSLGVAIVSALVPTATSGTVSVTFSASGATDLRVVTYRLVDCSINNTASARGAGVTSCITSITLSGTSVLILAGQGSTNTTGNGMIFGGATENYDFDMGGALSGRWGGALNVNIAAQANRPISLDMGVIADSGVELVAASFN